MGDFSGKFCSNPWTYCEIFGGGGVYICCPAYVHGKAIGNIFHNSFEEIWNSAQAQLFRKGVLDGSYCACDMQRCPGALTGTLPTHAEARGSWLADFVNDAIDNNRIIAARGPATVKLCYDASCNLMCPSCRNELMIAKKDEQAKLNEIRDKFILPLLKDTKVLSLSGDGDPFASNHYRDVMRMTYGVLPDLKIALHTNAVLLDERAWEDCHLEGRTVNVQVSVDAARAETYAWVRRGGDFERLKRNLRFISEKRRSSEGLGTFDILFVVQSHNYREMREFVELGRDLNVDTVHFALIDHWERGMDSAAYKNAKIWDKRHPEYADFIEVLKDPILNDPIVNLGGAAALLRDEALPELRIGAGVIARVEPGWASF
ncbi:MAG: SPASM domain-containing protein [Beijerinckiaceae bacterium]|jgi:MoaA/NifB/PqqE/SkfB family radical SAM enzyme